MVMPPGSKKTDALRRYGWVQIQQTMIWISKCGRPKGLLTKTFALSWSYDLDGGGVWREANAYVTWWTGKATRCPAHATQEYGTKRLH